MAGQGTVRETSELLLHLPGTRADFLITGCAEIVWVFQTMNIGGETSLTDPFLWIWGIEIVEEVTSSMTGKGTRGGHHLRPCLHHFHLSGADGDERREKGADRQSEVVWVALRRQRTIVTWGVDEMIDEEWAVTELVMRISYLDL